MASIRLLHRKQNGDIALRKPVRTEDAPAYAILSHTWGQEEVNLQDMNTEASRRKAMSKGGWRKIHFCAQQALNDGLQYFWVDTCCIDKKDAVELGAAINSMFRWYQDAARCYVYLPDVSKSDIDSENDTAWNRHFRRSRWFRRGWTLQELIAPHNVKFFSKEGNVLGSKSSLEHEFHEITQIPVQALRRSSLSDFTVAERMKWAARRETTIEEDQIYCLFGIFEVFMPPIYGEGKASALSRLQESIDRRHGNQLTPKKSDTLVTRASPYGRYRSLATVNPVLEIPTREIELILGKITDSQHIEITDIIEENCRIAAFEFFSENSLWRTKFSNDDRPTDLKLFQLPNGRFPEAPGDLTLRAWITKVKYASEARRNEADAVSIMMVQDYFSEDRYRFGNALNIFRITDAQGRLGALELESCVCYAIAWCWHLYASRCEARLKRLWAELHPTTIDENWELNLDYTRVTD